MAAASAGAIQTGFLSGTVALSSSQLQHSEQHSNDSTIVGPAFIDQQPNLIENQTLATPQHRVQYVQRINVGNYLNVKQHTLAHGSNVAPGWRRQLSDGEIVYFSPSGAVLRKLEQIKDYLLSDGTCKCGLPCPLRPDYFFEFNPQVPNLPLQLPPDNATNTTSCLHYTRLVEQRSSKDAQPTSFNQCMSTNQKLSVNLSSDIEDSAYSASETIPPESHIENVTVSRTPPWQKNSILNKNIGNLRASSPNCRVPALPQQQQLLCKEPPWQDETRKRRSVKKQPNFKEDPTGYLDQQTAILHSSILSVHSPELQDNEPTTYRTPPLLPSKSQAVTNQNLHVIETVSEHHQQMLTPLVQQQQQQQQQQNQNVYIQQYDNVVVPKSQVIIGSNGQTLRFIQSAPSSFYSSTADLQAASQVAGGSGLATSKQTQHLNTQTVQMQSKLGHGAKANASIPQQLQSQPFSSLQQSSKVVAAQQQIVLTHPILQQSGEQSEGEEASDQEPMDSDDFTKIRQHLVDNSQTGAATVNAAHLQNNVVEVHQNCDMNQEKCLPQTILIESTQQAHNAGLSAQSPYGDQTLAKECDPYGMSQKQGILTTCVASQESPVSSSTTRAIVFPACLRNRLELPNRWRRMDGQSGGEPPPQVGAISTSNDSASPPISSPDTSVSPELLTEPNYSGRTQRTTYVTGPTSGKNTITSVLAGKALTQTTTTNQSKLINDRHQLNEPAPFIQIHENRILKPASTITKQMNNVAPSINVNAVLKSAGARTLQTVASGTAIAPSSQPSLPNIQLQPSPNQIMMTSTGCQILVMPSQANKNSSQVIIGQSSNSKTLVVNSPTGDPNVVLSPQNTHMLTSEMISTLSDGSNIIQNTGNNVALSSPSMMSGNQNLMQASSNVINSNSNYIMNSPSAMQPMIINNSNLQLSHSGNVIHHPSQNVIQGNASNLLTPGNAANAGAILNSPNILTNQPNVISTGSQFLGGGSSGTLLSPNSAGIVLNQLPNASYVIQPQSFTTVDGQVMNVINADNSGNQFMQQTQPRIILSPDSKRRVRKRKSSSVSPQSNTSQPSPTITQAPPQPTTVLQIAPQYHQSQSFQTTIEQQILLQNGQAILQPLNLMGQQLLVPAGLMMTSDGVLQIQNVAPCGLLPPQGIVQNKSFLSPNSANQQFIMSGNGQISPIGQVIGQYSSPVGLVVPQTNGPTFVQQSTTIVQQQTAMMNNNSVVNKSDLNIPHSVSTQTTQATTMQVMASSPPDTTTHSPRSPERPESQRSVASDINMVQFVSSSEPDSNVSPIAESAPSPSNTDYDRNIHQTNLAFKSNESKIRRMQTPTQQTTSGNLISYKMKPDSFESPTSPATKAVMSPTANVFCVGELVWGAVRGHTAWPGKIVSAPNGCSPASDTTCWVRWFGGKPNVELVQIASLKSLSDGLEAHHKAQKDNRKSRKLNAHLEKAIQEAMTELDRVTITTTPEKKPGEAAVHVASDHRYLDSAVTAATVTEETPTKVPATTIQSASLSTPVTSKTTRGRITRATAAQQRTKLIKIAPAPQARKNAIS